MYAICPYGPRDDHYTVSHQFYFKTRIVAHVQFLTAPKLVSLSILLSCPWDMPAIYLTLCSSPCYSTFEICTHLLVFEICEPVWNKKVPLNCNHCIINYISEAKEQQKNAPGSAGPTLQQCGTEGKVFNITLQRTNQSIPEDGLLVASPTAAPIIDCVEIIDLPLVQEQPAPSAPTPQDTQRERRKEQNRVAQRKHRAIGSMVALLYKSLFLQFRVVTPNH